MTANNPQNSILTIFRVMKIVAVLLVLSTFVIGIHFSTRTLLIDCMVNFAFAGFYYSLIYVLFHKKQAQRSQNIH